MNKQPKIYFAYGSNLNLEDMKVRCPTARLLGAGRAEGHELMFRGHTPAPSRRSTTTRLPFSPDFSS